MQTQQKNITEDDFYFPKYTIFSSQTSVDTTKEIWGNWENNLIRYLSGIDNTLQALFENSNANSDVLVSLFVNFKQVFRIVQVFSLLTFKKVDVGQESSEISPFLGRAFSSSLRRAIVACNHLPFFKIFSNFVHFCKKFSNILPFFNIFLSFFALFLKNRTHALTF